MTNILFTHHAESLRMSSISEAVRDARGYYSLENREDILALGFREHQYKGSALMVPQYDYQGVLYETLMRPDNPRLNDKGKPIKYDRVIGSKNRLSINPAVKDVIRDVSLPKILTEGDKKADGAISAGIVAVSLTGVWGFRMTQAGSKLTLPDFNHIPFKSVEVYICYDSDAITKPEVYQAQVELGIEMDQLGAIVRYMRLPHGPNNEKWGIDDFLYGTPGDPKQLLADVMEAAQKTPFEPEAIRRKDDKFSYWAYAPTGQCYFLPTGTLYTAKAVDQRVGKVPTGGGNIKSASVWLMERRAVQGVAWEPGEDEIIEGKAPIEGGGWSYGEDLRTYNTYRAPEIDYAGDADKAQPWTSHVERLYPEHAEHMFDCFAFKVQHPEKKINHALVMGGEQGNGKDTILKPVLAAIGTHNYAEVSPTQMKDRFNSHVQTVILLVSELSDLGDATKYAFYEHMKTHITTPPDYIMVEEKFQPKVMAKNICLVIYTTNHRTDGLFIPNEHDRRHYVMWSDVKAEELGTLYFDGLYNWYANEGYAHVAAFLRDRDVSKFNPYAEPKKTREFYDLVQMNRGREDDEIADLIDQLGSPKVIDFSMLVVVGNHLRTVGDEMMSADTDIVAWMKDRKNARSLNRRIERAGYTAFRNEEAKDGRWKIDNKKYTFYTLANMSRNEKEVAIDEHIKNMGEQAQIVILPAKRAAQRQ